MPPADDTTGESFRGLVLQLRGRTGLTGITDAQCGTLFVLGAIERNARPASAG